MWIAAPLNWAIIGESTVVSPSSGTVFRPFQYTFPQLINPNIAEAFGAPAPEVDRPQGGNMWNSSRFHGVQRPLESGNHLALLDFA